MWIIYMCKNIINNKIYIGKTVQKLSFRKAKHLSDARLNRDNYCFHNALRKYGFNNFEWHILQSIPCGCKEALNSAEKFWIDYFDSQAPNGYNIEAGGDGHYRAVVVGERKTVNRKGKKYNWSKESLQSIRESKYKRNKIIELNVEFNSIQELAKYLIKNNYTKGKLDTVQGSISRVIKKNKKYHGLTIILI